MNKEIIRWLDSPHPQILRDGDKEIDLKEFYKYYSGVDDIDYQESYETCDNSESYIQNNKIVYQIKLPERKVHKYMNYIFKRLRDKSIELSKKYGIPELITVKMKSEFYKFCYFKS